MIKGDVAAKVREQILSSVSANGGHLASSLGAVELAIALTEVFDPELDRVVWDVGHQAYAWKILTGRGERFQTLRRHGGIAPFLTPDESATDAFISGHAGVAIAAAMGLAAGKVKGEVVAVVGDAALMNGESLEALRNLIRIGCKVTIILNDNGGTLETTRPTTFNENFFKAFGLPYVGPVDGHDVDALVKALTAAKESKTSIVVHAVTRKGKGFPPAEADPEAWHCVMAAKDKGSSYPTWSDRFGEAMVAAARRDDRVCAIVAAMKDGTGLSGFAKEFPDRFFDVGICEEMAVTFAAGLAKAGMRPVVAIYSTFLQRAIDQIQHDVCLQNLPVVFALDRAGCVGADGATHHGLYDIPLLRPLTGIRIFAPTCAEELRNILDDALSSEEPTAIRYPKGHAPTESDLGNCGLHSLPISSSAEGNGTQTVIYAVGDQVQKAVMVKRLLAKRGISAYVVPVNRVKPVAVDGIRANHTVSLENGTVCGGFGESIGADMKFGWPNAVVGHGTIEELELELGFDAESIASRIAVHLQETEEH